MAEYRHGRLKRLGTIACIAVTSMILAACGTKSLTVARQVTSAQVVENAKTFEDFVRQFRVRALSQGIKPDTFDAAFRGVAYNPSVSSSQRSQAEFDQPFWDYIDRRVTASRIDKGQERLAALKPTLESVGKDYGVPPSILVAIWGLESSYGANKGSHYVVQALATLSFESSRKGYWQDELIAALKILQNGYIKREQLLGSWAGAMGQTQFMPTTYLEHAVDRDGDGERNIWTALPDVFASTAKYLVQSKWTRDQPCVTEVRLPDGFDYAQAERTKRQPLKYWIDRSVRSIDGRSLLSGRGVSAETPVAIWLPVGHKGPAFAVYPNFSAIMAYNPAEAYALSVCQVANQIDGKPRITAAWPKQTRPLLSQAARREFQTLLAVKDPELRKIDGLIGPNTREAVRRYQIASGLIPDGYATHELLDRLRGAQAPTQ